MEKAKDELIKEYNKLINYLNKADDPNNSQESNKEQERGKLNE